MVYYNDPATSAEGLLELIRQGETTTVEIRAHPPPEPQLARVFSAFANTEGGILLIGADERGNIGTLPPPLVPDVLERLRQVSAQMLFEPADVNATRVGPHWIAYARIPRQPDHIRPVRTATGEWFTRTGASTIPGTESSPPPLEARQAPDGSDPCVVFVAMSFRQEEEPALVDYFEAMKRALAEARINATLDRIDLVEGDFEISQELMNRIDNAAGVIADLTLSPHNVYFELGYARGRRKPIIQTARKGTALEFDVRNWKTIFYRNATELEKALVPELQRLHREALSNRSTR